VPRAERAAKAQHVGPCGQQRRDHLAAQRSGEAADEPRLTTKRAETRRALDVPMREEAAIAFAARVDHRALEAQSREGRDKIEVGHGVGELHSDQRDVFRQFDERPAFAREQSAVHREFDIAHADAAQRARPRDQIVDDIGRIAQRRARRRAPRDRVDGLFDRSDRQGAESAAARVFQIDQIGADLDRDRGLARVEHAGEHQCHCAIT
jgi:hypothetical protein